MNNTKKAIFFDYDGTLVDEQEKIFTIPKSAQDALVQLRQNGHYTFLSTGRSCFYIPDEIKQHFSGIVSCNGAAVTLGDKEIFKKNIENLDTLDLYLFLEKYNISGLFEQNNTCYILPFNKTSFVKGMSHFSIRTEGYLEMPTDHNEISKIKMCKGIFFFNSQTDHDAFCDKYKDLYELRGGKGGYFYLDFNQKGVTKALGITKTIQTLGIDIQDTYAFGDGDNDIEMLQTVNHSVRMGRCSALLENVAKYQCETVKDNGISNQLKRFGLI